MSSIEYAMGRLNTTRADLIHMGTVAARTIGVDYKALPAGEQRAWQNAMIVHGYRKCQMSQDILERAMGRRAYDAAVTIADRYDAEATEPFEEMVGGRGDELIINATVMLMERAKELGLDLEEIRSVDSHALILGILAEKVTKAGDTQALDALREKCEPEMWDRAMAWNERYAKATGGTS